MINIREVSSKLGYDGLTFYKDWSRPQESVSPGEQETMVARVTLPYTRSGSGLS